ncbi:zinc finger protein 75A-like [Episyrphus balteatus]|uniref:zinc finger protein 75A-like n=1 Tax=Episyrphus balteatus TaxID=286459 RepID=UPI002486CB98|nr:zinc finger protein 75A-like [Episyrphus balteatus]
MLMHSDELPFKCDHCDKRFRRKKGLTVHLVSHSGAQPFICAFCEKPFSLRSNLKVHQRKIHPNELAKYEQEGKMTIITDVIKKKFACGRRDAKNDQ